MYTLQIPKKLAMINDLAGYGRCSTTVALPIISALKVQACPVPTSIFSNHTAFPHYHFTDYSSSMGSYLAAWEQLDLTFDGIYVGFLGSVAQMKIVEEFISGHPESTVIIDPVLGDHGKAYRTISAKHCSEMKRFINSAHLLTPNLTESCLLTDTSYKDTRWTADEIWKMTDILHNLGPQKIVITGVTNEDHLTNYISEYQNGHSLRSTQSVLIAGTSRPGTGDIFASILSADILNNVPLNASVEKAAEFVRCCIEGTSTLNVPVNQGVCFENHLSLLIEK